MLQKLRRAMIDPDRTLLEDLIEVDESDILYRTKADQSPAAKAEPPSARCTSSARSGYRPAASLAVFA